jgi:hypothetical protein
MVAEADPGYRDVPMRLENASRQLQLAALHVEARRLYQARQWEAVVRVGHLPRTAHPPPAVHSRHPMAASGELRELMIGVLTPTSSGHDIPSAVTSPVPPAGGTICQ